MRPVLRFQTHHGWIPTRSATPSTALVPQRKVGFPIPNAGLLLGFQGTKTARREGISSPFSDAGGCTSPQNSGWPFLHWIKLSSREPILKLASNPFQWFHDVITTVLVSFSGLPKSSISANCLVDLVLTVVQEDVLVSQNPSAA